MKKRVLYYAFLAFALSSALNAQGQDTQSSTEFKPSGKLWGYVFGDYYTKMHADSLNRGKGQYANMSKNSNAYAIRRIYLGYDYEVSKQFSTQLLLANENDNTDASSQRTFYIKQANLRWKSFLPNNDLILGQSSTPFFALTSESVWGYRSVEKTVADMRSFCGSNDLGIAVQGKYADGAYGYNVMLGNGTGQKVENDKYKKTYGEVYAKLLDKKIIIDLAATYEPAASSKDKTTYKGFVAYQTAPFTAGVEVVGQNQKNATTNSVTGEKINETPFAVSLFLRGQIIADKLGYFARYDFYNPDTKFDTDITYSSTPTTYKENFITAGLDWTPIKNVHLIPNIWYDSYSSMLDNQSGKAKSDYDLVARLTVHYIFK